MTRITLDDSMMDVMIKMGEGNIGAITVLMDIMGKSENVDPDNIFSFAHILSLDTHGIYGSNIWILYKDVCGENLTNMLAILRGVQLGIISIDVVKNDYMFITEYRGKMYDDFTGLIESVRKTVPSFGMN